ncbi:MAG: hypothetical protein K2H65_06240, partial [Bacteroidales bacterium]|nr:hypothetical protein [Bacteroidales bacterium]
SYTDQARYQPAFDTRLLRVSDVLRALDRYDYNEEYQPENSRIYTVFDTYLQTLSRHFTGSEADALVRDFKW